MAWSCYFAFDSIINCRILSVSNSSTDVDCPVHLVFCLLSWKQTNEIKCKHKCVLHNVYCVAGWKKNRSSHANSPKHAKQNFCLAQTSVAFWMYVFFVPQVVAAMWVVRSVWVSSNCSSTTCLPRWRRWPPVTTSACPTWLPFTRTFIQRRQRARQKRQLEVTGTTIIIKVSFIIKKSKKCA